MNEGNTDAWLSLARDAYSASNSYFESSVRTQIEADLRQFHGIHPLGSKYHSDAWKWRSRLFSPKTRATIRKNEAIAAEAFFSSMDALSILPENEKDDMQKVSAEIWQHVMQYRLSKTIPWFLTLVGAYQDAQTTGIVISRQWWEYRKKGQKVIDRPRITLLPIENFRFDPGANWMNVVETSPYLIELVPMYIKDVKARTRAPAESGEAPWLEVSDAALKKAVTPFSDPLRLARDANQRQDAKASHDQPITDFTVVWVYRITVEVNGTDWVYYTLTTEQMLSRKPMPLERAVPFGERPYVVGQCVIETHRIYPSGVPRLTRAQQQEINEIKNQRRDNVTFVLNKRYFVRRNKQIDIVSLRNNIPGSSTMVEDVEKDVKVNEFNDVTGSAYQEEDRANLDFDDVAGVFSGSSVQSNRRLNETVGGMNILTSNANQVSGYQLRTFVETWVEPVLRQVLRMEMELESDDRIFALAGSKSVGLQKMGLNAVTDEILDQELTAVVNVGMGATNPHQQVDVFLSAMRTIKEILMDGVFEKYNIRVDEVIKEVLGKVGHRDGGRFFDFETEDPRITSLKTQLQQLQSALDAKYPPELLKAQVEKATAEVMRVTAETTEKNVRAIFSAMQAAQVITAVPATAPPADQLLKSAGFQDQDGAPLATPPAGAVPGISAGNLFDPRTGITIEQNTSPGLPAPPASPEAGAAAGIETLRADSA